MQARKSGVVLPDVESSTVKRDIPGVNGTMELSGVYGRASWTVGIRGLLPVVPAGAG